MRTSPATLAAVPGVARVSPIATFDIAVDGVRIEARGGLTAPTSPPTAG